MDPGSSVMCANQETWRIRHNFSTHLSDQEKMQQVEGDTDSKNQDLVSDGWIQQLWEQVSHGGDETLHSHKLQTENT